MNKPEYPVFFDANMRNGSDQITLAAYQRMLTHFAEQYMKASCEEINALFQDNTAYIYVADTTEILNEFSYGDDIVCNVWLSERKGAASRLELVYMNHTRNQISFVSSVFFVVFNKELRRVVSDPESVFDFSNFAKGEKLIEAVSRCSMDYSEFRDAGERVALPSWIDAVGHVDNIRYLDMVYDALPAEYRCSMDRLQRCEMYFHREVKEGEKVNLKILDKDQSETAVAGFKEDGTPVFTCVLRLKIG